MTQATVHALAAENKVSLDEAEIIYKEGPQYSTR